jgi:glutamate-1-semialdehyde 2,1-aminomutase
MTSAFVIYALATTVGLFFIYRLVVRLQLSRAKHPSLRGHSNWSRRVARLVPFFSYDENGFFASDGAPTAIQQQRRQALRALQSRAEQQGAKTLAHCRSLKESVSDIRFTSRYRVPFPYTDQLPECFRLGSMVDESRGSQVRDLDGNWRYDLSGSYGVNVFGYDFYKQCMDEGIARTRALGPVLGAYHPLITENVNIIRKVSGLDEVSFHMSGTEAVMQAVRLARYHTGKTHLVRFCGAYHGWWDGVQPGIGNTRKARDVYTLADQSEQTLHILRTRKDIACVLINPLQAFHPNSDAPSDTALVASDRNNGFDKEGYTRWLAQVRKVCTERGIVLIFDEVFTGFRLAWRGAQEFYGIQADLVTYGKTLGGGLPIGVLAGTHRLMQRFKDNQPVNVSFARGTFNSHPYVMGAMNAFLNRARQPEFQQQYRQSENLWNQRVARFNQRLEREALPLRITNIHSILSVLYTRPSRYNWMLQFYLRDAGLELSWTGTGRLIMSYSFTDEDFNQVIERFIAAARTMEADGWWWQGPGLTNKAIKRQFLVDMLCARFPVLEGRLNGPLALPEQTTETKPVPAR